MALAGERIDDDTLKFVAGLPDLECLELGLCKVTGRGLGALGNLKNLKSLNLAVSATGGITEEGLARAGNCKALERIDATTEVTDKSLDDLSRITSLKMLYLCASRCRVTDAGVGCLARLQNLEHFGICPLNSAINTTGLLTDASMERLGTIRTLRSSAWTGRLPTPGSPTLPT